VEDQRPITTSFRRNALREKREGEGNQGKVVEGFTNWSPSRTGRTARGKGAQSVDGFIAGNRKKKGGEDWGLGIITGKGPSGRVAVREGILWEKRGAKYYHKPVLSVIGSDQSPGDGF